MAAILVAGDRAGRWHTGENGPSPRQYLEVADLLLNLSIEAGHPLQGEDFLVVYPTAQSGQQLREWIAAHVPDDVRPEFPT